MPNIGDRVRYLNAVGGGTITRIDGKTAYVDDGGFETPVLLKELVVVLPAGHEPDVKGARLMFDQAAFDKGRANDAPKPVGAPENSEPSPAPEPLPAAEETPQGEKLNLTLAFEPADIRKLSATSFNAVLVNDSNYRLCFTFLRRGADERGWSVVYAGQVEAQELIDLGSFTHQTLGDIERVAVQAIACKPEKPFTLKPAVSVSRRLDLTKFHKLHCFRPGVYFDTPVIEVPLVSNDVPVKAAEVSADTLRQAVGARKQQEKADIKELSKKYRVDSGSERGRRRDDPASNPHKLLPPIEIDLHIGELTDTLARMDNAAMLRLQLDTVEKTMQAHSRRIGQKIIFIHGKGEGVLRDAVRQLIRRRYPKAEMQDASFQEYGFGATLVTIH